MVSESSHNTKKRCYTGFVNRANVISVALSLALVGSLGANIALFTMGTSFFEQQNAVRLDPMGLDVYAAERSLAAPAIGTTRVVFFGDSRALMWPSPAARAGFEFVNRGIGYQTTAQILGRIDEDLAPLKPNIVVLELGVNDLKAIPLMPGKRALIVERCKANIAKVVARCRELGAKVILATVFPLGDIPLSRKVYMSSDVAVAISEVNTWVKSIGSQGITILEASPTLQDGSGHLQNKYAADFLHLSPEGYNALEPVLNKALEDSSR
jgi:lysophospholipase L1-like esterase